MAEAPFQVEIAARAEGVVDLRLTAPPEAVQLVFARIMEQAQAAADADPILRDVLRARNPRSAKAIAPETVLEVHGEAIFASMKAALVEWGVAVAAHELGLRWAGPPVAEVSEPRFGEPAVITARCYTVPELPAGVLAGFAARRAAVEPSEADVDAALAGLRRAAAKTRPSERAAAGDRMLVDVESSAGDRPLPDATFVGALVDLDPAGPHPELVQALLGKPAGVDVAATVDLGEHAVEVRAHIRAVEHLDLPALDAAFAKRFGVASMPALRRLLGETLRERRLLADETRVLAEACAHVLARTPVHAPEPLVRQRFAVVAQGALPERLRHGAHKAPTEAELEALFQRVRPACERDVQAGLVTAALVQLFGVAATEAEVRTWVRKNAPRFAMTPALVDAVCDDRQQLARFRQRVVQERLVDRLVTQPSG